MKGPRVKKNLAIGFAIILMAFSSILVNHAAAIGGGLKLPSTPVILEVGFPGAMSYFNTTLSDVPSGYDVTNGTYLGWCIDTSAVMAPSPAIHEVTLYSSLNPPANLTTMKWSMVNYVLNHKRGNVVDVQQAIWYFIDIDGKYTPTSTVAWTIVNDTLSNGTSFVPAVGNITAVICFPETVLPGAPSVQVSIIEAKVTTPTMPEFPSLAIPLLFALGTLSLAIAYKRKHHPDHKR